MGKPYTTDLRWGVLWYGVKEGNADYDSAFRKSLRISPAYPQLQEVEPIEDLQEK